MIQFLSVENLAIIESACLELGPGLTIFSGETGAGKSLLTDAIQLAMGGRAESAQVRSGAEAAKIKLRVVNAGLESVELERLVFAEGRSSAKIDGKVMPMSALRELGKSLADIHGQHDHQQLLNSDSHIEVFDDWMGEPARGLKAQMGKEWDQCVAARRRLEAKRHGLREWERRLDSLRFQIEEIEAIAPEVGEMEQVTARIERLRHAEQLNRLVNEALGNLADQEQNALDFISLADASLAKAMSFDSELAEFKDAVGDARVNLSEAAHALRNYLDGVEISPELLDQCQARLDDLQKLRRKYGETESEVLAHLAKVQAELIELTDFDASEEELVEELDRREEEASRTAAKLSALRLSQSSIFASGVLKEMKELSMSQAQFDLAHSPVELGPSGIDRIEFFFSANLGEPLKPLAKIASGGEMSRVMLAIKSVLAGKAGVPTLVFDEIDAGLSGQAATAMGIKLMELGRFYQVLAISHLPQICSRAQSHYKIQKAHKAGRTVTEVILLTDAEREEEIARLISGETITQASLANARELLSSGTSR